MAYTQADVDALKAEIARAGITGHVAYPDGAAITRIPVDKALLLLQTMQADVRANTSTAGVDFWLRPLRAFRGMVCSGY
jgi:hypothetical protein